MAKRRPSSDRWLRERAKDPYVLAARKAGYRSRAAYKLLEIQERLTKDPQTGPLIRPGMTIVDLGASPGGWSQIALKLAGPGGRVVAVDRLPMDSLEAQGVRDKTAITFILGDFLADETLASLQDILGGDGLVDLILSDMAPEMTGFKVADQGRGEALAESAFQFAELALIPGGAMVVKLFQGPGFHDLIREARLLFERVKVIKPKASRGRSPEQYLVALGWRKPEAESDSKPKSQEQPS
ncbi:MAG: RlmE family RNA methyltransferase [Magnetococcales bacterium]|nr:RlmE family RNA methyltransferase [Magnetococcales bacterium]